MKVFLVAFVFVLAGIASAKDNDHRPSILGRPETQNRAIKDASIREVITRVAHHQIRPLKDGDYPAVDSVAAAQIAQRPEGIGWNYPWGVTLYGMLHMNDATGDKEVARFVHQHNLIVARDY